MMSPYVPLEYGNLTTLLRSSKYRAKRTVSIRGPGTLRRQSTHGTSVRLRNEHFEEAEAEAQPVVWG